MKRIIEETDKYIIYIERPRLMLVKSIKCKTCDTTSYNENDVNKKYCGNCNKWHNLGTKQMKTTSDNAKIEIKIIGKK